MKRIIAAALLVVLSLSFLSACGGADSEKEPQKEDEYEEFYTYECFIGTSDGEDRAFSYRIETSQADEAMARMAEIAERHSCTVELKHLSDFSNAVASAAATMTAVCDIALTGSFVSRPLAAAGAFTDIDELADYIDRYNYDKWGALNVQEMCMVDGVLYGLVPSLWPQTLVGSDYYVVQNLGITKDYAIADLREAVENLTWSRDMLAEVINTCNDLSLATPIYGMSAITKHMVRASLLSNNCDMIVEENGELVCGWQTEAAVEALEWVKGFISNNISCFNRNNGSTIDTSETGDWGMIDLFCNGESSFVLTSLALITGNVAYKIDDFAILPWPTGPYGTPGQWKGYYENCTSVSVTSFANSEDYAAQVLDELYAPLPSTPDKEAMLQYYRDSVFHDDRDLDVILKQGENAGYCYWPDEGDAMLGGIVSEFFIKTPQQLIEQNLPKLQVVIEETIMPNYLAIQKIKAEGK